MILSNEFVAESKEDARKVKKKSSPKGQKRYNKHEGFDPGSERTVAVCLLHASRAIVRQLMKAADG